MSKSKVYKLGQQRRETNGDKLNRFRMFFEVLDEAVEPFKSGHKMPQANAGDSRFGTAVIKGKPKIKFEFIAKPNHVVEVLIDVKDLVANPKEYIDNMLECLNDGMKQAVRDERIIIPTAFEKRIIDQAVS